MQVIIRSETPSDYSAIMEVHALAFENEPAIGAMVALHRQHRAFDPHMSLVAEAEGRTIGHILFFPRRLAVDGAEAEIVILSPLAVHPDWQRQGIGGLLIEEGHRRAEAKGYAASLVLGHPSYYPRFGYRTNMYGMCRQLFQTERMAGRKLEEQTVRPADMPLVETMWQSWFAGAGLAIRPAFSLLDWFSPHPSIRSVLLMDGEEPAGYLRYKKDDPAHPRLFLARDQEATAAVLAHLVALCRDAGIEGRELALPVHPDSVAGKEWLPDPYESALSAWDAGMIRVFGDHFPPIRRYVEEAASGTRSVGQIIWPVEFDIME